MKVVGLYLVRNEVDLIEVNLRHHFATAIDEAIVIDNGSSDGTLEKMVVLAESMPIRLASEPGPYDQSARVTRMAREAFREGADWVLPIDADEFWIGTDEPLRSVLADVPGHVSALRAEVVNFVQSREVLTAGPTNLLSMTMRPPRQVGPIELCEELVESQAIGFVEMMYPPKWVSRATPTMVITNGNHGVIGLPDSVISTDRVLCLHAPLRARSLLTGKLDQGRRVIEDEGRKDCWHVRRWWRLSRQGTVDAEWGANSYDQGSLDVGGQARELVPDMRLRDAVVAALAPSASVEPEAGDAMHPAIAAYLLALDTVPGSLSALDFRLLVAVDGIAREHGVRGDILEIGVGSGQRAILLGHLARLSGRRLSLFDPGAPSAGDVATWRRVLVDQYLRFHDQPPVLCRDLTTAVGTEILGGGFGLVVVNDAAAWGAVWQQFSGFDALLERGGIITLDAAVASVPPGADASAWEGHLPNGTVPLCMTDGRLYGSSDPDSVNWLRDIDAWIDVHTDVTCENQTLGGQPIRRLRTVRRPPVTQGLSRIPSLERLVTGDPAPPHPQDFYGPGSGDGHESPELAADAAASDTHYDATFYGFTGDAARSSAEVIVPLVLELTRAESVVDVGCGIGSWLSVFRRCAVDDVFGLDGEHVDLDMLEIPRAVFQPWNLERRLPVERRFDLAVCLEVAEHVSADRADGLIDDLVRLAPIVLFSGAVPFQGGVGHVNEQWPTYWVRKFADRGLSVIDAVRPSVWDNESVAMWYAQNCLLFATSDAVDRYESLATALKETNERQLDLVHPSLYLYHRLGLTSPAWRVPLDAAADEGRAAPPLFEDRPHHHQAPSDPDGGPPAAPEPVLGLRALLKELPVAMRRALLTRLDRRRRIP